MKTLYDLKELSILTNNEHVHKDIYEHKFKPSSKIDVYLYNDMYHVTSRVSVETAKKMCIENAKNELPYKLGKTHIVI